MSASPAVATTEQMESPVRSTSSSSNQVSALRGNSQVFFADFLASWGATALSICLSRPVDTARIRRQAHRRAHVLDTAPIQSQHIVDLNARTRHFSAEAMARRATHVRSLYDGFLTPIFTTGPVFAVSLAFND